MQPPTPTIIPTPNPASLPLDLPSYSLWDFAPQAVQQWNTIPPAVTLIVQAVVLIFIVAFGYFLLTAFLRNLSNEAVVTEE